jgi:translation initiation factor IF-3
MEKKHFTRVNYQIKVPIIRLIKDNQQIGIVKTDDARRMAQEAGLDLVEIVSHTNPPVCHILDYEKYRYEQAQKDKEQKRKQRESFIEMKEVRFRPGIQDHDIETKVNTIRRFIEEGKKVQVSLVFKNREITHKEEGVKVVEKIISSVKDIANVAKQPKLEGFRLLCILEPN